MTRHPAPRRHGLWFLILAVLSCAGLRGQQEVLVVRVAAEEGERAVHAAISALPAGGGVVELGAGTFRLTQPIILDRSDVELRGQGVETRLELAPQANCPVVVVGNVSTPTEWLVRKVTVRKLSIDGNRIEQRFECWDGLCDEQGRTALRNNGITIRGAEDVLVEDVVISRARSGGVVLEKHCRRVRLQRVEAYDNEFDGVAAYETEDSDFSELNLHHNRSAGFSFDWRFNRNRITNSKAEDNASQGIFMRDSNGNLFERLLLRNNGEQGLFMAETRELPGTACRYNRFEEMIITGNRTQGIRINDASCQPNTLADSFVKDNRLEDISLAEAGQLEVVRSKEK